VLWPAVLGLSAFSYKVELRREVVPPYSRVADRAVQGSTTRENDVVLWIAALSRPCSDALTPIVGVPYAVVGSSPNCSARWTEDGWHPKWRSRWVLTDCSS